MNSTTNIPRFVILFQCHDQKGIVAKISEFILACEGNIVTADQHSTDPEGGHFFMRVEFVLAKPEPILETLHVRFQPLAEEFQAQWCIYDKSKPMRMGILVSKPGHCLFDLLYLRGSGELKAQISFVASNFPGHRALVEQFGVPFHFIPATNNNTHEDTLLSLALPNTDFLVLARYMQILSPEFLRNYGKDIINIHHGLLPSFKGPDPYRQAFDKGVKVIGATAHFVTNTLDEGPIIAQDVVSVCHRDDHHSLTLKGKNLEKKALAQAVMNYLDYRVIRYAEKTIVF